MTFFGLVSLFVLKFYPRLGFITGHFENRLKQFFQLFAGTKIDLREDKETLQVLADAGQAPIKREQGQKLANKIRAIKYLECSALTQRGLKQVCSLAMQ